MHLDFVLFYIYRKSSHSELTKIRNKKIPIRALHPDKNEGF